MKITAIKQQVKRPDRYSIYIEGKFAFGLSEGALLDSKLATGQELDEAKIAELHSTAANDKAYGNALRYVVMRPRSLWEMQTYLYRKKVDEPVAEQIIERLKGLDLLDDKKFAEAWVANRRLLKATSKRRLQLELQQKHVSRQIIEAVLHEDESDERTVLAELVAKKQAKYPDRQKFTQYLMRQGFRYDDISAVLNVSS